MLDTFRFQLTGSHGSFDDHCVTRRVKLCRGVATAFTQGDLLGSMPGQGRMEVTLDA